MLKHVEEEEDGDEGEEEEMKKKMGMKKKILNAGCRSCRAFIVLPVYSCGSF